MTSKRKYSPSLRKVWVGYSDGEPHIFENELDGRHVCVYLTRKEARKHYEDVRQVRLCVQRRGKRRVVARV